MLEDFFREDKVAENEQDTDGKLIYLPYALRSTIREIRYSRGKVTWLFRFHFTRLDKSISDPHVLRYGLTNNGS